MTLRSPKKSKIPELNEIVYMLLTPKTSFFVEAITRNKTTSRGNRDICLAAARGIQLSLILK